MEAECLEQLDLGQYVVQPRMLRAEQAKSPSLRVLKPGRLTSVATARARIPDSRCAAFSSGPLFNIAVEVSGQRNHAIFDFDLLGINRRFPSATRLECRFSAVCPFS